MKPGRLLIVLATIALTLPAEEHAQTLKAGLWDVTTRTARSRPDDAQGRFNSSTLRQPDEETATLPVCYTRDLIDKFGLALPPSLRDCELLHVTRKSQSLTADLNCKGAFNGRGSLETTWTDANHAVGKIHFISKSRGAQPVTLRWSQDLTAVYKGADCGNVHPRAVPSRPPKP